MPRDKDLKLVSVKIGSNDLAHLDRMASEHGIIKGRSAMIRFAILKLLDNHTTAEASKEAAA